MQPKKKMATRETIRFRTRLENLVKGRQEEIARRAGISRVYLSKIVNGHCNPSIEIASKLSSAVGLTLGEMTREEICEKVAS